MEKEERKTFYGFSSENRFDREAFSSPSSDYAPIYTWMWNGALSEEETSRQLDEMMRLRIKRFYILPMPKSFRPTSFPTPLEPEYLSDGYFAHYRFTAEQAAKRGMTMWLYDEGGWPSGGACGQVVLDDPTLASETVTCAERSFPKGSAYLPSEEAEASFLADQRISEGYIFEKDAVVTEYRRVRTSFPRVHSADYPDIIKKGATERFISLTLDKYEKVLSDLFGKTVTALFTDEPTAPRPFPYTDEIKALFRERFGEEIEGYLPVLMGKTKASGKSAEIKKAFFEMLNGLFCKRFLEKEKAWANARSLAYLGHLDKDDEANGSMTGGSFGLLPALRRFDVPGVDAIRRQIFPPKGKKGLYGENKSFPRYASSAAAQRGSRHALSESFAVYGQGLSYDEMRYVVNFQAMRGVTLFNPMVVPYGRSGYQMAGLLPHFTEAAYPDLSLFNEYLSRLSYLFSLGRRVAKVALFDPTAEKGNPVIAVAFERTAAELEERRIPFDFADEEFLSFAKAESGRLCAGVAFYETVVIPPCESLSEGSIARLSEFLRSGGNILSLSEKISPLLPGAKQVSDLSELASPLPLANADGLGFAEAETEDGSLCFLMNEKDEAKTLSLPDTHTLPYLITPTDGKVRRLTAKEGRCEIEISAGEIVALFYGETALSCDDPDPTQKSMILSSWTFRPTERFVMAEREKRIPLTEEARPASTGDWRRMLGEGFSGSGEYRTTFSLSPIKRAILDLGGVANAAEVLLNGVSLGKKILSPYRFDLPLSLLRETNELVVRITNGAANEFEHTHTFDDCRPWQLGNYIGEERLFHRDSLAGGLLGEVRIIYEE